jgi:hypothetical protein
MKIADRLQPLDVTVAGVVHDPDRDLTLGLNPTGRFMFLKLREGLDAPAVARAVAAEFDGAGGHDLEQDVRDFVGMLVQKRLIEPGDLF